MLFLFGIYSVVGSISYAWRGIFKTRINTIFCVLFFGLMSSYLLRLFVRQLFGRCILLPSSGVPYLSGYRNDLTWEFKVWLFVKVGVPENLFHTQMKNAGGNVDRNVVLQIIKIKIRTAVRKTTQQYYIANSQKFRQNKYISNDLVFSNLVFFWVLLLESSGLYLSANTFLMLFIYWAFLLCPFLSHILLQDWFDSSACICCFTLVISPKIC